MSFFITGFLVLLSAVIVMGRMLFETQQKERKQTRILTETRQDLIRQLRQAEHFRMACEHANDGMVIQTLDGKVVWPNPAYCRIMGYSAEDMIGRNPLEFALPDEDTPSAEDIAAFRYHPDDPTHEQLQLFRNKRANGELFWNQLSISFRKSAVGEDHAILICRDVTAQIEQEQRLREVRNTLAYQARHDSLTGLANRAAFLDFARDALETARKTGTQIGLLQVDLDHFKAINDTHGHSAGDAALSHAADALRMEMGQDDLVARIGGDEFVAVIPTASSLEDLQGIGNRVANRIGEPVDWNGRQFTTGSSIGAALSQNGETDPDTLLLQADFALYDAKRLGRGQVRAYDETLYKRHMLEIHRANELTDAIDTGGLDYVFQPTYDLKNRRVTGFETLVRWNHAEDGMIRPDVFLPIAAELGLMGALDLGSMTRALEQKHELDSAGYDGLTIAFNASADLLAHPEFINRLVWGVEAGGVSRNRVTIEVLETTAFGDAAETSSHAATIRDLRDAGFQVHLDDFGVGYAGLSHLAQLAVTGVKIDRSLILNLLRDATSAKIVRKIIELCNDLGLDVIAEGVENCETAEKLRDMGCQSIQGYWISRPLVPDTLLPWLKENSGTAPLRLISG